jgi:hypothetical protein
MALGNSETPTDPAIHTQESKTMAKLRIREAVKLAEGHALGILKSADDLAFWGEDFFYDHCEDGDWQVLTKARKIIMNRLKRKYDE